MPSGEHGTRRLRHAAARLKLGHAISTPSTRRAWIDFAGPAGTIPAAEFRRRRARQLRRRRRTRQDRRRRRDRAGARATSTRADGRPRCPARAPGGVDRHGAVGFPLRDAPGWVDVAPHDRPRRGRAAGRDALRRARGGARGVVASPRSCRRSARVQRRVVSSQSCRRLPRRSPASSRRCSSSTPVASVVNRLLDRVSPGAGMNRRTRRLRTVLLLGAALFCTLGGLGAHGGDGLRRLDLTSVDMRFDVRGAQPTPDDVVVVGIDDQTFNAPGTTFPFSRKHHATGHPQPDKAGAAVIAYDVQFTQPSGDDDADNALIEAVRRGPQVVIAATESTEDGKTQIFGGGEALAYSRAIPGNSNFEKDADGASAACSYDSRRSRRFPIAARAIEATAARVATRRATPPGSTSRAAEHGPVPELRRRRQGQVPRVRREGQGRRRRRHARPSLQDLHETSTTGRRRCPGPRSTPTRSPPRSTASRCDSGPGWIDIAAARRCSASPRRSRPSGCGCSSRSRSGPRAHRRAARRRAGRVQRRRDHHRGLRAGGRHRRAAPHRRHPRRHRRLRAREHARRVRALRPRVGRRPGPPGRRRRSASAACAARRR